MAQYLGSANNFEIMDHKIKRGDQIAIFRVVLHGGDFERNELN